MKALVEGAVSHPLSMYMSIMGIVNLLDLAAPPGRLTSVESRQGWERWINHGRDDL